MTFDPFVFAAGAIAGAAVVLVYWWWCLRRIDARARRDFEELKRGRAP